MIFQLRRVIILAIVISVAFANTVSCTIFHNKGDDQLKADSLVNKKPTTFCNPINLNYYMIEHGSFGAGNWKGQEEYAFREAADPSICVFNDKYYLFTSIADGYWVSDDLTTWSFLNIEDKSDGMMGNPAFFAPTAVKIDDTMYYTRGGTGIWKTQTPQDPNSWTLMPDTTHGLDDIQFFYDSDIDKLYVTHGCSGKYEIYIQEFDKKTMTPIGERITVRTTDYLNRGFDRCYAGWWGDDSSLENEGSNYTEGSQLFKYKGKYYLIYAGQNLNNTYCDSVLISDSPVGPFEYQNYNPVSMKMRGFANGAGHGEKFEDLHGNWWNVVTQNIYTYDSAERRISIFPMGFTDDGQMMCDTYLGDMPLKVSTNPEENGTKQRNAGYYLLSKNKPVTVSSTLKGYSVDDGVDNNIRTFWSAQTGDRGEFFQVDLLDVCDINSVQINFCEVDAIRPVYRENNKLQYKLEYSVDNKNWKLLCDKSNADTDLPHDYIELNDTVKARYIKVTNISTPYGAKFSIRDLRVFGKSIEQLPEKAAFNIKRDYDDTRNMEVTWERADRAEGYIVRFGNEPERMFQVYECYDRDATSAKIRYLMTNTEYYVTVDTVNSGGITKGDIILKTGDSNNIYEAEKSSLSSGAIVALNLNETNNLEAASGGSVVDMSVQGATCKFKSTVTNDDKYRIGIHYSSYGNSNINVSVNGSNLTTLEAKNTGGFTAFNKVLIMEENLNKGDNEIAIISEGGNLILDCISVNPIDRENNIIYNAQLLNKSIDSLPEKNKITKFYEKTILSIIEKYNNLSSSEKEQVKDYNKITKLQKEISKIKNKEKAQIVRMVQDEISSLPNARKIDLDKKSQVMSSAKSFYDLKLDEQKLVNNSAKLIKALDKLRELSGNTAKTKTVIDKFEIEYSPHPSWLASEQVGIGWDPSLGIRRNDFNNDAYVTYEAQLQEMDYFTGCRVVLQLSGIYDRIDIFTSVNGIEWIPYDWKSMKSVNDDPEDFEAFNSITPFPQNSRYIKFSIPIINPEQGPVYAIILRSVTLHGVPLY